MKPLPLAVAAGALFAIAGPAAAQNLEVTVSPYFWAASLEGDVSPLPNLPVVHVDQGFDEILDTLQLGLASTFELRLGRWAVVGDISYVDTGSTAELPGPNVLFTSAGLDSKTVMSTMGASWRLMEDDYGNSFDVIGGARINWADNDVRLIRIDGSQLVAGDEQLWVDPVIGVRGAAQFTERWGVVGYGDVGGFGVSSDLTWQVLGTVHFRFTEMIAVSAGYRYYMIDYENDGFVFDVVQQGPIIGASFAF